jgi:hypothetical protein
MLCAVAAIGAAGPCLAQEAAAPLAAPAPIAPKSNAQIDAGEPRAHTSAAAADDPGSTGAAPAGKAPAAGAARTAKATPSKAPGAADRLDLGTATVTGDREQPKVMYIVPWKNSDIGDLSGKPMNSLLDEALSPVDREEFKREVVYYQAVRADAAHNTAKPPPQGEK